MVVAVARGGVIAPLNSLDFFHWLQMPFVADAHAALFCTMPDHLTGVAS